MPRKIKKFTLADFIKDISIVFSLVLIWRGIWYLLDFIDAELFGGVHAWTALGGVILGLVILYFPDKDLKELERL